MNCPHHCEIYNVRPWSYKDLPKRWIWYCILRAKWWIHGFTRVRGFKDDAYFCTPEQLDEEFKKVIDLLYVFGSLGFENFTAQISLRDKENRDKYIGSDENWEKAENAIINAAADKGLNTVVEYEKLLLWTKVRFHGKDALGRQWQLKTIQVIITYQNVLIWLQRIW
jgi:threonyl-tRNA synthetase